MDFTDWLAAKGFDNPTAMNDAQRTFMQGVWRSEQNGGTGAGNTGTGTQGGAKPGTPEDDFKTNMTKFRENEARERRIVVMVGEAITSSPGRLDELEEVGKKALAGKWNETETELALLRVARPGSPAVANGMSAVSGKVVEAAIAQAAGLDDMEGNYDERTLEVAHKKYKGGMGILQLFDVAARQNGYRGDAAAKSNLREVMEYAFPQRTAHQQQYGPRGDGSNISTISTPGILSNVANKFVRVAFLAVDQSLMKITAKRSVTDFKQITSYSLTGDLSYKEIAPGGFLDHGTLGETSYTNQARSYGRILGIDRRDIINDNLGAYSTVNKRMGRGGATKMNKVGWGKFLDNATFFSSGNANVSTGAGSALGIAGLKAAEAVFKLQTDPDGELLGSTPAILLTPTALAGDGWTLMNSQTVVASTTTDKPLGDKNPFVGRFEPVESPYLQDPTLTGYSAAAWYLLGSPEDLPVIEACYLNGVQMPLVETTDADFNQLGLMIRGVFDFGFALQEYRGGVRSAGS